MNVIAIIPARMNSSRFPGKPLKLINNIPMVGHCYQRALLCKKLSAVYVATCDLDIKNYIKSIGGNVIMTSKKHKRASERVSEAMLKIEKMTNKKTDIVVMIQGDEPMMRPDMMDAVVAPLIANNSIPCTVLAMHITDEKLWLNPDTVKIVHKADGEVLYTSRAPVPFAKDGFSNELEARRIYGILAFRWRYLKEFTTSAETRLELLEACDSNRILDLPFAQYVAPYPSIKSFSVDSPSDAELVKKHILQDDITKLYLN